MGRGFEPLRGHQKPPFKGGFFIPPLPHTKGTVLSVCYKERVDTVLWINTGGTETKKIKKQPFGDAKKIKTARLRRKNPNHNVGTCLRQCVAANYPRITQHAKGEGTEKVEKGDFWAVGNGKLWLTPSCAHSLLRSFIRLHGVNHNQPFPTATSLHEILTSFTIFIVFQCFWSITSLPDLVFRRRRAVFALLTMPPTS